MTPREKRMVVVLGVFLAFGAAFAGYSLVYGPIKAAKAEAEKLEGDISAKQAALVKIVKDKPRVEAAKKRSLPADPDTARVEYDAMMRRLLRTAGAPAGFTVTPKDSLDAKNVPMLDARTKKPAYQRLGFEIRMKRVEIGTVAAFLQAFYKLNLLHQITRLEIVRKDQEGAGSRFRAGSDRADLEVVIQTEAIILDGAESRKTLLPVPVGAAAVGGGAGYHALLQTPEAGRGISPLQLAPVLAAATPPREYTLVTAKDYFHGPLPPPREPEKPKEVVVKEPEKPKEDISPFIKLTGITRRSDGTVTADVRDQANNQDYQIDLKPKGERYEVKVKKFFYLKDQRKPLDSWAELVIKEENTTTNRTFKVAGVDGDGLVLTETTTLAGNGNGSKPAAPGPRPKGPVRGSEPVKLPAAPPAAAVVGGPGVALAPAGEKVFVWRVGQPLKALTELTAKEADDALRRAAPTYAAGEGPGQSPVSKAD